MLERERERREVGFKEKNHERKKVGLFFFYIKMVNFQSMRLQRLRLEDEVIHIQARVKSYQLMTAAISGALCN